MTATVPPLGPTAPAWDHAPVVEAIARGGDWQREVADYWGLTVDGRAHDLAHPRPVYACPGCPQTVNCPSCGLPTLVCVNPSGHDRVWRGGETSLLVGGDR